MNDAACDPQGRFWAGTLADDHHRRRRDPLPARRAAGRSELLIDGLTISNGWDGARTAARCTSSTAVRAGAWPSTSTASAAPSRSSAHSSTVDEEHRGAGRPDRRCGRRPVGGGIRRRSGSPVHPVGVLLDVMTVPAVQSTSCAFGGAGLNTLYVTTATEGWNDERRLADPAAGHRLPIRNRRDGASGRALPARSGMVAASVDATSTPGRTE